MGLDWDRESRDRGTKTQGERTTELQKVKQRSRERERGRVPGVGVEGRAQRLRGEEIET